MKSTLLCLSVALPLNLAAAEIDYPSWVINTPPDQAAYCQKITENAEQARYLAYARASMLLPMRAENVRYGRETLNVTNTAAQYDVQIKGSTNGQIASPYNYSVDDEYTNGIEVCVLVAP